jgi:uncharacterized protein YrrD
MRQNDYRLSGGVILRRAQDIIGLPVIAVKKGKQIGKVRDIMIDSEWNACGILLEHKRWFSSPKYVAWEDLISVGDDAVMLGSEDAVHSEEEKFPEVILWNGSHRKIHGMPVVTVNGHQLGIIEDVYFGENMGRKIVGYELTDGLISDLREGRKWLPAPEQVTLGEDAVIVPVQSEQDLKENLTSIRE